MQANNESTHLGRRVRDKNAWRAPRDVKEHTCALSHHAREKKYSDTRQAQRNSPKTELSGLPPAAMSARRVLDRCSLSLAHDDTSQGKNSSPTTKGSMHERKTPAQPPLPHRKARRLLQPRRTNTPRLHDQDSMHQSQVDLCVFLSTLVERKRREHCRKLTPARNLCKVSHSLRSSD